MDEQRQRILIIEYERGTHLGSLDNPPKTLDEWEEIFRQNKKLAFPPDRFFDLCRSAYERYAPVIKIITPNTWLTTASVTPS